MLVKELLSACNAPLKAFFEALAVAIIVRVANDQTGAIWMVIAEQLHLRISGRLPTFSSLLDILNVLSVHAEYVGESPEILLAKLPGFVLRSNDLEKSKRVRCRLEI